MRSLFITGLGIGQICSWGSLYYSFPLIAEAMERELGWSKTELFGAASAGLLLAALAAYPVGAAIDRGYGRLVMTSGSILAGILLIVWSQVSSIIIFYLALAGIGALQAATLYEPAFAVVARRAGPINARAGITALTLWGGFASTVFIPLVQLLLDHVGWRDTLIILGGINLTVCAGFYAAVIDPGADAPPRDAQRAGASSRSKEGSAVMASVVRKPTFWALGLAFTAYSATFSAFTFHLYPLLNERGFDTTSVVMAMAIIGPAQVVGRIAIWVFAPRAPIRLIGSCVVSIFPIVLFALMVVPASFGFVAVLAMLYGGANGIMTIVRGIAVPEMLTRDAYGAVNGALAGPSMVIRALAPAGAAAIWAASGSYDAVLVALITGSVVLAVSFWTAAVASRPERG